jgi:DNA repair exonuclease SbcCD ATPase subunit
MAKCPVCRQPLPKAIDMEELQARLEEITARARTQEKQALETAFRKRLPRLLEAERESARRSVDVPSRAIPFVLSASCQTLTIFANRAIRGLP